MQSCAIISLAWLAGHAVSPVVPLRCNVPSASLPFATTAGNSTGNAIPIILLTSSTSLAHHFSHSPIQPA